MAGPSDLPGDLALHETHTILPILPNHTANKLETSEGVLCCSDGHHRSVADWPGFHPDLCVRPSSQVLGYEPQGHMPAAVCDAKYECVSKHCIGLYHPAAPASYHLATRVAPEAKVGARRHILSWFLVSLTPSPPTIFFPCEYLLADPNLAPASLPSCVSP